MSILIKRNLSLISSEIQAIIIFPDDLRTGSRIPTTQFEKPGCLSLCLYYLMSPSGSENPASYLKELRIWQSGNTQGIFQSCNRSPGRLCLLDSLAFKFIFREPTTKALMELANLFCLGLLTPPALNQFLSL